MDTIEQIEAKTQELYPYKGLSIADRTVVWLQRQAYIKGALSRQSEILQLKERIEKTLILLHDLTPGGSEFVNDPEYCAKWIRQNRFEESMSLKKIIVSQKQRIKALEGSEEPFSLMHILSHLIKATEILLHKKNYDGPDYEDMERSVKRGKDIQQLLTKNNHYEQRRNT